MRRRSAEGRCRGCDKRIVWAVDPNGKKIPLDPTPPVYDVVMNDDGTASCERTRDAMVSHFATCPDANRFSGGGRRG